jgi:hypothetical protein
MRSIVGHPGHAVAGFSGESSGQPGPGTEAEPRCGFCGERIGVFAGTGPYWMHYRGDEPSGPFQVVDPGHDPVVTWRPAAMAEVRS